MILKQLKQLTLSATRRNAQLLRLPRLYSSPAAVSQTLLTTTTTSKPSKRLSRNDRRLVVESFVSKYRAANAGKFPSLKATVREVGGGYYIVRDILQELKLRPNAPPVSQVPDEASSLKQDHTIESSHPISVEVSLQGDNSLIESSHHEVSLQGGNSLIESSHSISDEVSLQGDNSLIESSHPSSDEVSLQGDNSFVESSHPISVEVSSLQGDNSLIESSHPSSDEVSLQGDNSLVESSHPSSDEVSVQEDNSLVIPATHDRSETVTASLDKDVDCKCDGSSTHLPEIQTLKVPEECLKTEEEEILTHLSSQEPKPDCHEGGAASLDKDVDNKCDGSSNHFPDIQTLKVSEECLKKPEIEEDETLTEIASQEPRADHIEGGAASANVLPTETRQEEKEDAEVKTGENSSAWSNIVSFAREFVSFWRKG